MKDSTKAIIYLTCFRFFEYMYSKQRYLRFFGLGIPTLLEIQFGYNLRIYAKSFRRYNLAWTC